MNFISILLATAGKDSAFDGFDQASGSRLWLLGLDRKALKSRITAHPIPFQLTEIVDFGNRSANATFQLPHLHALKLVYAHMLTEVGLVEEALG